MRAANGPHLRPGVRPWGSCLEWLRLHRTPFPDTTASELLPSGSPNARGPDSEGAPLFVSWHKHNAKQERGKVVTKGKPVPSASSPRDRARAATRLIWSLAVVPGPTSPLYASCVIHFSKHSKQNLPTPKQNLPTQRRGSTAGWERPGRGSFTVSRAVV